jgi:hypothetical protein
MYFADTHQLVENGELVDRICDPTDKKISFVPNSTTNKPIKPNDLCVSYLNPFGNLEVVFSNVESPTLWNWNAFICDYV